jgi:hypothetical protein
MMIGRDLSDAPVDILAGVDGLIMALKKHDLLRSGGKIRILVDRDTWNRLRHVEQTAMLRWWQTGEGKAHLDALGVTFELDEGKRDV